MVKFISSLINGWLYHLVKNKEIVTASNKFEWFLANMESVLILIVTIMFLAIMIMSIGQFSSDYTVPRFKSMHWCGENSKVPC